MHFSTPVILTFILCVSGRSGPAVAQAVSGRLPTSTVRVCIRAEHVRFVVDKAALGKVFSE
jgi:hypothetical protein